MPVGKVEGKDMTKEELDEVWEMYGTKKGKFKKLVNYKHN